MNNNSMDFRPLSILKISLILGIIVFIIERVIFNGGFNLPLLDLMKIFSIHFLYALVLTFVNGYYLDRKSVV